MSSGIEARGTSATNADDRKQQETTNPQHMGGSRKSRLNAPKSDLCQDKTPLRKVKVLMEHGQPAASCTKEKREEKNPFVCSEIVHPVQVIRPEDKEKKGRFAPPFRQSPPPRLFRARRRRLQTLCWTCSPSRHRLGSLVVFTTFWLKTNGNIWLP